MYVGLGLVPVFNSPHCNAVLKLKMEMKTSNKYLGFPCSPVGAVPGVGEAEGPGVVALGPGRGTQGGGHEEAQQNHSETGDTLLIVTHYCSLTV